MNLHLSDYLCEDWERFRCVRFLDVSGYEQFNFIFKRAYLRPYIRRGSRRQETSCTWELIVQGLEAKERDEVRRAEAPVKARKI